MTGKKVTLLGTGIMGAPMARNIAKAGFDITVWNRTLQKAKHLGDVAHIATSAAQASKGADVIITMLENSAAVTHVLFAQDGVVASKEGACFIDMSSIQPSVARDHSAQINALGRTYIDAPVSGGEKGATDGTLAIMAGGDAQDIDNVAAVFSAMGTVTHVGAAGAGQVAKLANQAIVAITIGAVSEALLLAQVGGCDPAAVRSAIMGGFATSRILDLHGQRMVERNWVPGGPLRMQIKDLDNVLEVAADAGITLPLTECARAAFDDLTNKMNMGEYDHSAYLLWLEAQNTGTRLGSATDQTP